MSNVLPQKKKGSNPLTGYLCIRTSEHVALFFLEASRNCIEIIKKKSLY